jgi:hypothetical protein
VTVYDAIGATYTSTRRPDPRIGDCTDGFGAGYRLVIAEF